MKNLKSFYKENFVNRQSTNFKFKIQFQTFGFSNPNEKEGKLAKSETNLNKEKLDLHEYDGREFSRTIDDPTDKTKPYDNMYIKVSRPDLKEQYEKRKDIFHTLDTPYLKKEENKNDSDEKSKKN